MAKIDQVAAAFFGAFRPPPKLSLSEWADAHAVLSSESSAEAGRWHTIPYQKGIMDCFTDPEIEAVWVQKSARVGWTKILNHVIAFHIHQDPCSIMMVQPTIEDAEGYSKEEIAPMLRDTPALSGLVQDAKAKDGSNTILTKVYPGGTLGIVGANSPRGFRRVSRRVVLFDEVDGYPVSAGTEGDQIKLGIRRSEYFWNRKIGGGSTPTTKDTSKIERIFGATDQRRYFVPCLQCGEMQYLQWKNLKWPEGEPELAYFVCEYNGCVMPHADKRRMVERGEWRATARSTNPRHVGFHIWAAYSYSPNASWGTLAAEFLEAKGDVETLKTFVNTVLGETWEEEYSAKVGAEGLRARVEDYEPGVVPDKVLALVAGVDVQDNRVAITIDGYGRGEENWTIDHMEIFGDPARPEIWKQLDDVLFRKYRRVDGGEMGIAAIGIDTGGHFTHEVYQYARMRRSKFVLAMKGQSQRGGPVIGKPRRMDVNIRGEVLKGGVELYPVGADTAKVTIFGRLKLPAPGPGFIHFHGGLKEEYFRQLTAEKQTVRYHKGHAIREWVKKPGARNEALDCKVYALAAMQWLYTRYNRNTIWNQFEKKLGIAGVPAAAPVIVPETAPEVTASQDKPPQNIETPLKNARAARNMGLNRRRGGFVSSW